MSICHSHLTESDLWSGFVARAPTQADALSATLRRAYADALPDDAAFTDLLHVLNWIDVSEC